MKSPVFNMEDANGTLEVACFSPCPVRALRLPSLWTEGKTGSSLSPVHPSAGVHWSLLSPLVCEFRLNWLTHKTRCVRDSVPRRALPRFRRFTVAFLSQVTTS